MNLLALLIIVPILTGVLLLVGALLAAHRPDAEKVSTYECGYDTLRGQTRAPFTISYYLVSVLFLVFDIELITLQPYITVVSHVGTYGFWIVTLFFLVLTFGFVVEVASGVLAFTDHRSAIKDVVITNGYQASTNGTHSNSPLPILIVLPLVPEGLFESSWWLVLVVITLVIVYLDPYFWYHPEAYFLILPWNWLVTLFNESGPWYLFDVVEMICWCLVEFGLVNDCILDIAIPYPNALVILTFMHLHRPLTSRQIADFIYKDGCYSRGLSTQAKAIGETLGLPNHAIDIALKQMLSDKEVTLGVLNSILVHFAGTVTQAELNLLLAQPTINVPLPVKRNPLAAAVLGRHLPSKHKDLANNRYAGVYFFEHLTKALKYVGSSVYLAARVNAHFKPSTLNLYPDRRLVQALHGSDASQYTLRVILIPKDMYDNDQDAMRLCRALEQWHLLSGKFTLNTLPVSGQTSMGTRPESTRSLIQAKAIQRQTPVYVYNAEGSVLLYEAPATSVLAEHAGVRLSACYNACSNGHKMLGSFIVTRTPLQNAVKELLTQTELATRMKAAEAAKKQLALLKMESALASGKKVSTVPIVVTDLNSGLKFEAQSPAKAAAYTCSHEDKSRHMTTADVYALFEGNKSKLVKSKGWSLERYHTRALPNRLKYLPKIK